MFLNALSDLGDQDMIPVPPQDSEFDFVVAQRPKYIPGSGPPLAPISIMPAHNNKNGYILAHFENHGHPKYIVSYEDKPQLRVSVAPENILKWVSPRTFEEYEFKQAQLRAGNGKRKAKVDPSQRVFEPRDESEPKQKGRPGKKRKHAVIEEGDGPSKGLTGPPSRSSRARKSVEEPIFISSQRPTLASPSKQRGLAYMVNTESEEDEELSTDIAIKAQLSSTMANRPHSRLGREVSMSENSSPEPSRSSSKKRSVKQALAPTSRETRSSSRQDRGSSGRSGSVSTTSNEAKRQRRSARHESVATTSSREASVVYNSLERRNKKTHSKSFEQYPFLVKNNKAKVAPESEPDEQDEGEGEFEVREIVDDEVLKVGKKQKSVIYYRIRWVGDWDLTREPAVNVGLEAIAEYNRKKALGCASIAHLWYNEEGKKLENRIGEMEPASLFVKPNKKRTKGGKGSDGADDESDPESLFGNPSKRSTTGLAAKFTQPVRGEVIDDDDEIDDLVV